MKKPKLVVGHLMNDELLVKSVRTSKSLNRSKRKLDCEIVQIDNRGDIY